MSMDEITELVGKDCPIMTTAVSASNDGASSQITKLTKQRDGVLSVLSTIKGLMIPEVITEAAEFSTGVPYYKTPDSIPTSAAANYGVTTTINGNIRDWQIDVVSPYDDTSNFVKLSDVSFSFDGINGTPIVSSGGSLIYCGSPSTYERCLVSTSTALSSAPYTNLVTVSAGTVPDDISSVNYITSSVTSTEYASGGSYYNANINKWMNDYDFGIDHLYHPLDQTGTYGIIAQLSVMTSGATTISANKTKIDNMDSSYRDYSQWTPLVSGADVEYYYENQFLVSGDMTSYFPVSADLLIDCGDDGSKGCIVSTAEYISPSGASYTDFTIIMLLDPLMTSPETSGLPSSAMNLSFYDDVTNNNRLLSITLSGDVVPISGAIWVDYVTFYAPGDLTSTIPTGSTLICEFTPSGSGDTVYFTPRYFTVYECEHKQDIRENGEGDNINYWDKTLVTISNGLPITKNISVVNIVGS